MKGQWFILCAVAHINMYWEKKNYSACFTPVFLDLNVTVAYVLWQL